MVEDRKPNVESVQETGLEVLKSADEDKKADIEIGLADINSQWVELNELVDERRLVLEETLEAANKFDELYKDVIKKIVDCDTHLKSDEFAIKAKPEEIKEQMAELEVKKGFFVLMNCNLLSLSVFISLSVNALPSFVGIFLFFRFYRKHITRICLMLCRAF